MTTPSNNKSGNAIRIVTFAALFASLLISSGAQASTDTTVAHPVEFKYAGSVDSNPVFQIDFDNPEGKEVLLTLKDEYGTVLYSELVKGKVYSRRIRFEDADLDNAKVIVTLYSKELHQTQSFTVNRSFHSIEGVEVAKL